MKLTLLGTGTSFGVPQIGCSCEVCTSADPRDARTRTSALVQQGRTTLLIDTPPELRQQLITACVSSIDAVLFTHEHADHTHGIDDLRAITARRNGRLPAYGPASTLECLSRRFNYIFDPDRVDGPGTFIPHLASMPLDPARPTTIGEIEVVPVPVQHAGLTVYGYRFGAIAYVTDVKRLSRESRDLLEGVQFLVLSALFEHPHPAHLSIPEAIAMAEDLGVQRAWLTHLTHRTGHQALEARLPPHVRPAYDGLVVEADAP